jgi:hypothetical protein
MGNGSADSSSSRFQKEYVKNWIIKNQSFSWD